MFDLDHFKAINDYHDHLPGDAALDLVAGVVREHLVSGDLFGRFGGDEFMIACSGQNAQTTAALAEALRVVVAQHTAEARPSIPNLTLRPKPAPPAATNPRGSLPALMRRCSAPNSAAATAWQ